MNVRLTASSALLFPTCEAARLKKSCSQSKSLLPILLITMLPCGPDECSLMHSSTSSNLYSS